MVSLESVPLSVQLSGPSPLGADGGTTGFSLSSPRSGSHQLRPARVGCLRGFRFAGQDRIVPGLLLHNRIAFGWLPRETKVRVVWLATRLFPVVGHRTPRRPSGTRAISACAAACLARFVNLAATLCPAVVRSARVRDGPILILYCVGMAGMIPARER